MLFTIRQEPGCSENFTLIISLDRHHITQESAKHTLQQIQNQSYYKNNHEP